MNLPKISFSRPSFSLRFFVYVLFGLIILILAAEGGYYFYYRFQHQFDKKMITGRIKTKKDKVLLIERFGKNVDREIKVEIAPDAKVVKAVPSDGSQQSEILNPADFLNALNVGEMVSLLRLRPRLLKEPIANVIIWRTGTD